MFIYDVPLDKLPELVAGLVAKGLTFEARPLSDNPEVYTISFTGGY